MAEIYDAAGQADIFVAIGTSGAVYPAAGLVGAAQQNGRGCETIEINPKPTGNSAFKHVIAQTAALGVPELLEMFHLRYKNPDG
jgi:NAD-dependent deacetylase